MEVNMIHTKELFAQPYQSTTTLLALYVVAI
jgi:hypothetical protein